MPDAPRNTSQPSGDGSGVRLGAITDAHGEDHSRRDDLGAFIRKQREGAKLSLRNLSKLAGVSNPYLSQIERGLRNPSAEILQAIAKALDLSAETLYVRAGILDERTEGDVESAIARDPSLTEHQRATLIEMYRTFRAVTEAAVQQARPAAPGSGDAAGDAGRRAGALDELVDRLMPGDVTDADIAGTITPHEDPDEA